MHVVDMRAIDEAVQRRVDRRGARIQVERTVRIKWHQRAVAVLVLVELLERQELVHIKSGEAVELHRAQVTARTFDPQDVDLRAGERILLLDLRGRVAAAEVGDALVAAQQIRTVKQQIGGREPGCVSVIPSIFDFERRLGRLLNHSHPMSPVRTALKYARTASFYGEAV